MLTRVFLTCVFAASVILSQSGVVLSGDGVVRKPADWLSGIGWSSDADPVVAGGEAAAKAKAGLGGGAAKFVMVTAAKPLLAPELLVGVREHFPDDIIYGCEVTTPWTPAGNSPDIKELDAPTGVGVWALGGDVDIFVACESTAVSVAGDAEPYHTAGVNLAGKLKDVIEGSERPGRLVVTWGDQYNGSNKDFARGLNDGFGEVWPIVGGASGSGDAKIIYRGEIVQGVNIGVFFGGEFIVGLSRQGGPHQPRTADKALGEAAKVGGGEEPFFALLFNCRRRRLAMMDAGNLAEEHGVVLRHLAGGEFFGFYGPGEIGAERNGVASQGAGFTIVVAMLFAK